MKKIIAILLTVAMAACFFTGCETKPGETTTPTKSPEETVAPATATPDPATPTPDPATPTPDPATPTPTPGWHEPVADVVSDQYTWEYKFNEDDPTTVNPAIVLREGVDPRDIFEVEVPSTLDGYKVTHIGDDLLGSRSEWGGRKGLCQVYDPDQPDVWTDPIVAVETIIFPDTIEVFEGNTFWFGGSSIEEIIFKGTDNIRKFGRYALHPTPAEAYMTEDAGGFLVINGMLICALADQTVIFPDNVVETVNCFFAAKYEDYEEVEVIVVNDGCKKLDWGFTEALGSEYLTNLKDIYIPASVEFIDDGAIWWWNMKANGGDFKVHVVEGSYADEYFKAHDYLASEIVYDTWNK